MGLSGKYWIDSNDGTMVPVEDYHDMDVLAHPTRFGFPPEMLGTEFEDAVHQMQLGRWDREYSSDINYRLRRVMFERGWVRVDTSSSDDIQIEADSIRRVSEVLKQLLDHGASFISANIDLIPPGSPRNQSVDFIEIDDWEQIEALAYHNRLPRRYQHLTQKKPRVVPALPMSKRVGVGMESFLAQARARLIEARTKTRAPVQDIEFADPTSRGEVAPAAQPAPPRARSNRIPGRQARPGDIGRIQVPNNASTRAARAALQTAIRDVGPDSVSDEEALRHAGVDPTRRLGNPVPRLGEPPERPEVQNALVPLNQLPALIDQQTGEDLDLVWHKITSLPHYVVQQIRAAFRPIFKSAMNAELEAVSVCTSLPGAGTAEPDLDRLWNFLMARGRIDDQFALEAFGIDPNVYHIDESHVVDFGGHRFWLMIERMAGMGTFKYIYVAPGQGRGNPEIEQRGQFRLGNRG